jgi:hypothetical protein
MAQQTTILSRAAGAVFIILCVQSLTFAAEWNTRYFYLWKYDAHTRAVAERIAARHEDDDPRKVTIGATVFLEPTLNYYIQRLRLDWIKSVERGPLDSAYDFYVLSKDDQAVINKHYLHVIYRDKLSGTVLARPADCTDLPRLGDRHLGG